MSKTQEIFSHEELATMFDELVQERNFLLEETEELRRKHEVVGLTLSVLHQVLEDVLKPQDYEHVQTVTMRVVNKIDPTILEELLEDD